MSRSILNTQKGVCYRCGKYGPTELHHIFMGTANRRLSDEDGLIVYLCPNCHNRPPEGVHFNMTTRRWLEKVGQEAYEGHMIQNGLAPAEAKERFRRRYGKNYL